MSRVLVAVLLLPCAGFAAQQPFLHLPLVPAAPSLEADLDSGLWSQAAAIPGFQLLDATDSPEAQTTARACHDGRRLYLGVTCQEPQMDKLQARSAPRDADIWTGDVVEVFVGGAQPNHYYHIMLNASGAISDEECHGPAKQPGWNGDIEVAASRTETSWTVAASIALADLGIKPGDAARGFNLCRSRIPVRELSCWSPTLSGFHVPERFGRIVPGTDASAVTALDWGKPWPGDNVLKLRSTTQAPAVEMSLTCAGATEALSLSSGAAGEFGYSFRGLGSLLLAVEARAGESLLTRQYATVLVADYRDEIARLRERLTRMPEGGAELPGLQKAAGALEQLAQRAAQPEAVVAAEWPGLGEEIHALSRHLDTLQVEALANAADPQAGFGLGVQSSLVKMLRHEPFTGQIEAPLALRSARREYEAAQLVVFAFDDELKQVSLELGDLVSADGKARLDRRHLSWRHVQYILTERPTYPVPFVGLWPDPLVPVESFEVPARGFEAAWITAYVPPGTPAGDYSGTVTVRTGNAGTRTLPLQLHVYGFTLPRTNHLKTSFGAGMARGLDSRKWWDNMLDHRISPTSLVGAPVEPARWDLSGFDRIVFSARLTGGRPETGPSFEVGYARVGAQQYGPIPLTEHWQEFVVPLGQGREHINGLGLSFPSPVEATVGLRDLRAVGPEGALELAADAEQWFGGSGSRVSGGDEGGIRLSFSAAAGGEGEWLADWPQTVASVWEAGNVPAKMDFTRFDFEVQRYLRRGLTAVCIGLPSTAYKQDRDAAVGQLRRSGTAALARGWGQHLRQRGWLDLAYTYMADEPEHEFYETLNAMLAEVHRGDPGINNMMTARGAGAPELTHVDIWCPEVYSFNPEGAAAQQKLGKEVWWYVAFSTRHPFPNYWIDYPALDCRVHFWMTWKHKLDGILYWSINYRTFDNWKTAMCYPGANGDGHLTYPAPDGGVIDSIRWEAIRDGAEDYELLWMLSEAVKMAEDRGLGSDLVLRARELLAIDDGVVRSYRDYNPDPAVLVAERDRMAEVLEALCLRLGDQPRDEVPRPTALQGQEQTATPALQDKPASPGAVVLQQVAGAAGLVYGFESDLPYAKDQSGAGHHGIVSGGTRCEGRFGRGLHLSGEDSCVRMPAGEVLLGSRAAQGTVALWVKPDDDPSQMAADTWSGYAVFLYLQKHSSNGLPDGYNEIGLSQHGQTLNGRVTTTNGLGPNTSTGLPLVQGKWTHLALTWSPTERVLYVDGEQVARVTGSFEPVTLDSTAGLIGMHPPTRRWTFKGAVDEVLVSPETYSAERVKALTTGPAGRALSD